MKLGKPLNIDDIIVSENVNYKSSKKYIEQESLRNSKKKLLKAKKFLNKKEILNSRLLFLDDIIDDESPEMFYKDVITDDYDYNLFDKYFMVSKFVDIKLSYNSIKNSSILKEFSYDFFVEEEHEIWNEQNFKITVVLDEIIDKDKTEFDVCEDWNCILICEHRYLFLNSNLLALMKKEPEKKYVVNCAVMHFLKVFEIDDSEVEAKDERAPCGTKYHWDAEFPWYWNAIMNADMYSDKNIEAAVKEIYEKCYKKDAPKLELKHIPNNKKITFYKDPLYSYKYSYKGIYGLYIDLPYEIYSKCVAKRQTNLIYNIDTESFFSEDKNQTALNVLAYDIAKNGLQKPIIFQYENFHNKNNTQEPVLNVISSTRLIIAEYLKLESIPCYIFIDTNSRKLDNSKKGPNAYRRDREMYTYESVPKEYRIKLGQFLKDFFPV